MKLPAGIEKSAARFDAMTLRERALVAAAALVALLMVWLLSFMDPITAKRNALLNERDEIRTTLESGDGTSGDPDAAALLRAQKLQGSLNEVNAKLAATSAGLIPPERMVQVIRDVLDRQHGLTLVSLHNKPVTDLVTPVESATGDAPAEESESAGPFMHPVELVLEGNYLDVLAYLKALEALPWRFYWKVLELRTTDYPTNRVRIELGTLSMDKEWLGV